MYLLFQELWDFVESDCNGDLEMILLLTDEGIIYLWEFESFVWFNMKINLQTKTMYFMLESKSSFSVSDLYKFAQMLPENYTSCLMVTKY